MAPVQTNRQALKFLQVECVKHQRKLIVEYVYISKQVYAQMEHGVWHVKCMVQHSDSEVVLETTCQAEKTLKTPQKRRLPLSCASATLINKDLVSSEELQGHRT